MQTTNTKCAKGWGFFCLLLGVLFFLRGQAVLQFYPSMEGFDEFQHTAYLIHLAEQGTIPVLGETLVPKSLYPEIANNPHADVSMGQAGLVGALKYRHFYTSSPTTNLNTDILLFQAQHPPVYYLLTWRLFDRVRAAYGYREGVYVLRSIQLALGGLAMALLLYPLPRLIRDPGIVRLAALVISLLPMYLIYILRVSNDALALVFAALCFLILAHIRSDRDLVARSLALGLLLSAGAMTKTIAFLFLPVAMAFLFFLFFDRSFARWRVALSLLAVPAVYVACCYRYHLASKEKFGTMFPALETIVNAEKHHDLKALLATIEPSDLWTFFIDRLVINNVWKSGMTFLEPHVNWETAIALILCAGVAGWFVRFARRDDRAALLKAEPGRYLLLCLLTVGSTFAGAYVHGLNCRLAWGALITPAYYVMVAFPALLGLLVYGMAAFPRGVTAMLLLMQGALYVGAEMDSLLRVALPYWTASTSVPEIVTRARLLGSAWTEPLLAVLWWIMSFCLLGLLLLCSFRSLSRREAGSP